MSYDIRFLPNAEKQLLFWQRSDRNTLKRILDLIANMRETPYTGLGHPEALRYELSGMYSRRIDKKNRIVYRVDEDTRTIVIHQLRFHY